jgi:hypothetical protein
MAAGGVFIGLPVSNFPKEKVTHPDIIRAAMIPPANINPLLRGLLAVQSSMRGSSSKAEAGLRRGGSGSARSIPGRLGSIKAIVCSISFP